jgi:hypothetical protein
VADEQLSTIARRRWAAIGLGVVALLVALLAPLVAVVLYLVAALLFLVLPLVGLHRNRTHPHPPATRTGTDQGA